MVKLCQAHHPNYADINVANKAHATTAATTPVHANLPTLGVSTPNVNLPTTEAVTRIQQTHLPTIHP